MFVLYGNLLIWVLKCIIEKLFIENEMILIKEILFLFNNFVFYFSFCGVLFVVF